MKDTVVLPRENFTVRAVKRLRWLFLCTPKMGSMLGFIAGVVTLLCLLGVFGLGTQQTNNVYFNVHPVFAMEEYDHGDAVFDFNVCADTIRLGFRGRASLMEDAYE